jgi:hypothetical protein
MSAIGVSLPPATRAEIVEQPPLPLLVVTATVPLRLPAGIGNFAGTVATLG